MKQITKTIFLQLCRGSRLIKIQNIDSPALYESTAYSYLCKDTTVIHKIETRSLKPNGKTTIAYYKEA